MDKTKKTPSSIYSLILTAIAIVSWVIFSIYQALVKPQPTVVPPEILEPLDPKIDPSLLRQLEERFYIDEGETPELVPPTNSSENTQSGTPVATPQPVSENKTGPTLTPTPNNE